MPTRILYVIVASILAALLAGAPTEATAQRTDSGDAYVIDGDTLVVNGARIRLYGVDAPEYNAKNPAKSQYCERNGEPFPCGEAAATVLARHVKNRIVTCTQKDTDRYGRLVSECYVGGENINRWLVANGIALAYRQFSTAYAADEDLARSRKVGLWGMVFENPWNFRKRQSGGG